MIYILPLIAGILYGTGNLINKRVANLVDNPWLSSLVFNIASLFVSLLLLLQDINSGGVVISKNSFDWILITVSMFLTAFAFWGLYRSMRELPVSEQTLLSRASIITYTIGGFIVLGESVTSNQLLGILLILFGIIISSIRKGKFVFNKFALLQIVSSVGFGLTVMIDKTVSGNFSTGAYVFVNILTSTIAILFCAIATKSLAGLKSISREYYLTTIMSGGISVLAYFVLIQSYNLGGLMTISGALSQIKIIISVFGGYIFFGEKNDLYVKLIGVTTVIAGAIMLKMQLYQYISRIDYSRQTVYI